MKSLYFDCFAGIAGDMILGALLDLGLDAHLLQKELGKLPLQGYQITIQRVKKQAIQATKFSVMLHEEGGERLADNEFQETDLASGLPEKGPAGEGERAKADHAHHSEHHQPARSLAEILHVIEASDLSAQVRALSIRIFTRLGEAEAQVHHQPLGEIHLHEVGAVDAIVDIVGAAIGLELLGVSEVYASPLHLGSGFVRSAHGLLPVPAPATAQLLTNIPVYTTQVKGELVTPTGAAIISTVAKGFGPMPEMKIQATGYGAGSREREFPNVLRAFLGETISPAEGSSSHTRPNRRPYPEQHAVPELPAGYHISPAVVIEANLDDMQPQFYETLVERLLEADALDVTLAPVQMKKNRPGIQLQVLASPNAVDSLLAIIFSESTTIGVRTYEVQKRMLQRETVLVNTPYGTLRVKIARLGNKVVNTAPEYEDCRRLANELNVPVKDIYNAALVAVPQGPSSK